MNAIPTDNRSAPVDALGRVSFARHLLALVVAVDATHGAVVGLEGSWGSGKTWVLEQLKPVAEEHESGAPTAVVVSFNPWMVSGTSGLVEALLLQIAAEVAVALPGKTNEGLALAQKIIDYAGTLSVLKHLSPMANLLAPGSGLILEGIAHATGAAKAAADDLKPALDQLRKHPERLSLRAMREAIAGAIGTFGQRLVVVVDDLDRLPPAELAATIQAVKAVADFPNVVYVLSYDPEVVANGLKQALGVPDGAAYLEKIVQVPLRVPEVPAALFRRHAEGTIRQALVGLPPDAFRQDDLDPALHIAAALLTTPREVRRLTTRLAVIVQTEPTMCRDINIGDLVLIEALQLVLPELVDWIDQHKSHVLLAGHEQRGSVVAFPDDYVVGEPDRNARVAALESEMKALVTKRKGGHIPAIQAMGYLFDSPLAGRVEQPNRNRRFRIQRYRQWDRWRAYVSHQEVLENSELEQLLKEPDRVQHHWVYEDSAPFNRFLTLVVDHAAQLRAVDGIGFAKLMVLASHKFPEGELFENERYGCGPAAAVEAVLRATRAEPQRQSALEILVKGASIAVAYWALRVARDDLYGSSSGSIGQPPKKAGDQLVSDAGAVASLTAIWQKRALAQFADTAFDWAGAPYLTPYLLACWLQQTGEAAVTIKSALTAFAGQSRKTFDALVADFVDSRFDRPPDPAIFPDADLVLKWFQLHGIGFEGFSRLYTHLVPGADADGT